MKKNQLCMTDEGIFAFSIEFLAYNDTHPLADISNTTDATQQLQFLVVPCCAAAAG